MFSAEPFDRYAKSRMIADNASDIRLALDTDDVDPRDVTDANVQRIVQALNCEFYQDTSHFRSHPLPEGLTESDRECVVRIAEALSRRDNWGDQRCGPEQAKYLERALRALNGREW